MFAYRCAAGAAGARAVLCLFADDFFPHAMNMTSPPIFVVSLRVSCFRGLFSIFREN